MKKKTKLLVLLLVGMTLFALTSCKCEHEYTENIVAPTCTENGYTEHICSKCKDTYRDNETEAVGHTYIETANTATCTEDGEKTVSCTVCGETYSEAVSAFGHNMTTETVPATCTSSGIEKTACSLCGYTEHETPLPLIDHNWLEATCVLPKTCSMCGLTEGEALGHDYVKTQVVEATTEAEGYTLYTCTRCGLTDKRDITDKLCAHEYDKGVAVEPTCTTEGYTLYTCSKCGESYKENTVSAKGHKWNKATCTSPKTCSVCGTTQGSATGHTWASATCHSAKHCTTCGATSGDPLGHKWKNATCQSPKTCERCGVTEGTVSGHNWIDATCTEPKHCTNCGLTSGSALGHSWIPATTSAPKTCKTCGVTQGSKLSNVELPEQAKYDMPDWFYMLDVETEVGGVEYYLYSSGRILVDSESELIQVPGVFYSYYGDFNGKSEYKMTVNVKDYIEGITEFNPEVLTVAKQYKVNAKLLQFWVVQRSPYYSSDFDFKTYVIDQEYYGFGWAIEEWEEANKNKEEVAVAISDGFVDLEGIYQKATGKEFRYILMKEIDKINPNVRGVGCGNLHECYEYDNTFSPYTASYTTLENAQNAIIKANETSVKSFAKTGKWDNSSLKKYDRLDYETNKHLLFYAGSYYMKVQIPDTVTTLQDLSSLAISAIASESDLLGKLELRFGEDNELCFGTISRYSDYFTFYVQGNYLYIGYICEYYGALRDPDNNGQNQYIYAGMKTTVETIYPNVQYKN